MIVYVVINDVKDYDVDGNSVDKTYIDSVYLNRGQAQAHVQRMIGTDSGRYYVQKHEVTNGT